MITSNTILTTIMNTKIYTTTANFNGPQIKDTIITLTSSPTFIVHILATLHEYPHTLWWASCRSFFVSRSARTILHLLIRMLRISSFQAVVLGGLHPPCQPKFYSLAKYCSCCPCVVVLIFLFGHV